MKTISLITLFITAASCIGYSQDSIRTNSVTTYSNSTTTTSQTYNSDMDRKFTAFKVGLGLGYAAPSQADGASGGILIYLEPAYRVTDKVLIGLRLEDAFIVRGVTGTNNNNDLKGDATSNLSYTLNGQYYFNDNNVRPFVGAGLGMFSLAAVKFNTANNNNNNPTTSNVDANTVFGFYPRIGIDAKHFNLTVDYNFIPKTNIIGGGSVTNNYLGIRAGISIGGGRIAK